MTPADRRRPLIIGPEGRVTGIGEPENDSHGAMGDDFYRILKAQFPDASEAALWRTVVRLIVAVADAQDLLLEDIGALLLRSK